MGFKNRQSRQRDLECETQATVDNGRETEHETGIRHESSTKAKVGLHLEAH